MKQLMEAIEQQVRASEAKGQTPAENYLGEQLRAQASFVQRAVMLMKSLHADIDALRVDGGERFAGIGECEYGHEGVGVQLEWPNLAMLADCLKELLDDIAKAEQPSWWYVFHGDCTQSCHYQAHNPEQALQYFRETLPDAEVVAIVPAGEHEQLIMYGYGEDIVRCPKCSTRTDFSEMPRDGWQHHRCLSAECGFNFIACPE